MDGRLLGTRRTEFTASATKLTRVDDQAKCATMQPGPQQ